MHKDMRSVMAAAVMVPLSAAVLIGGGIAVENRNNDLPDVEIVVVETAPEEKTTIETEPETVNAVEDIMVNINTADKEELMMLNGIGEKTAEAIIEYRQGKCFESVDELLNVSGIGDKKLENIRNNVCV